MSYTATQARRAHRSELERISKIHAETEEPTLRRIALIVSAILCVLLISQSSWAQTATQPAQDAPAKTEEPAATVKEATTPKAVEETRKDIERWSRVIDRVQERLNQPGLTSFVYNNLRSTIQEAQAKLAEARPVLVKEVERIRKLIDALGPPPKEDQPPESPEIAAQRQQLNDQLASVDGQLKQLDLLLEKSRGILAAISTAESAALGDKLLQRTPSLFAAETWSRSASDIARVMERARSDISQWYTSPRVQKAASSGNLVLAVAAVILAAVLGWILRRWLVRNYGRKPGVAEPTYRMRVRAALAEATARTAIPIIATMVAYAVLKAGGFLFELPGQIALGIAIAIVILSILYGLPRSMLSPSIPQWRLAALGDGAARLWYRYAVTLAIIVALDAMLITPAAELRPSQELQTTYNFLINSAYAIIFLLFAIDKRLWLTPEEEAAAGMPGTTRTVSHKPPSRSRWWMLARTIIAIAAIAIPVSAIAGYGVLSVFIARRMLATACVFLIAIVLHGLARDIVAVFTRTPDTRGRDQEELSPLYIWSVLFLDIGLVLTMVFVIVPLWGGQWNMFLDRFGWSLTGFKIGEHVFSITDVLAGMVVFIIALALVRFIQHFVRRRILQHTRMDSGVRDALTKSIGYAGLVIAVVIAVTTAGIDLSGLALVAGALSVGVGFGLQSIVNNFVSGLILLAERPIKVGDWVQVGNYEGIVQSISVRSTEIKTFSRASVIVPNSELISSSVVNWMHKDRSGRVEIPIGVAYGSDTETVRNALLQCAERNEYVAQTPEPYVLFMEFSDSALLFELRCYVADVDRLLITKSELRFAIDKAFREENISIPFPQRDLHIKDIGELGELLAEKRAPERKTARRRQTPRSASGKSSADSEASTTPDDSD